ncbi:MAG TPA: hypothetical protein VHA52_11730 [Candidatus Babeliaceae bacterium]|nr:hypothetical protein [Candidatus Babeliaceae bacterium]
MATALSRIGQVIDTINSNGKIIGFLLDLSEAFRKFQEIPSSERRGRLAEYCACALHVIRLSADVYSISSTKPSILRHHRDQNETFHDFIDLFLENQENHGGDSQKIKNGLSFFHSLLDKENAAYRECFRAAHHADAIALCCDLGIHFVESGSKSRVMLLLKSCTRLGYIMESTSHIDCDEHLQPNKNINELAKTFKKVENFATTVIIFDRLIKEYKTWSSNPNRREEALDLNAPLGPYEISIPEAYQDDVTLNQFICPINGSPIRFPVTLKGKIQTKMGEEVLEREFDYHFERAAIVAWVRTCMSRQSPIINPVTRLPFDPRHLVVNRDLQAFIENRLRELDILHGHRRSWCLMM